MDVGAAQQGLEHGVRLVVDFLFHEGREAALFRGGRVPVDVVFLALGGGAVEVRDFHGVGGDRDDLVLAEFDGAPGVVDEAGDVGAEEVLALAEADDERGVPAGRDHDVGLVGVDGEQREGAFEPLAGKLHGPGEAAVGGVTAELVPVDVPEQGGRHFGVGLGLEGHALAQEFQLELGEVLDDAVVDQGQLAAVGQVRVRVLVRRAAVRGPARVADSREGFRQRAGLQLRDEVAQFARLLPGRNGAVGNHRNARGVVAAVLQAPQSFKDNVQGIVSSIYPAI